MTFIDVDHVSVKVSADVSEYLELLRVSLKLDSKAEVVGRIVVDSFGDDIRKHPEMRPEPLRAELAKLEAQAVQLFDDCAAKGLVTP